jgi:hypothetical protein
MQDMAHQGAAKDPESRPILYKHSSAKCQSTIKSGVAWRLGPLIGHCQSVRPSVGVKGLKGGVWLTEGAPKPGVAILG